MSKTESATRNAQNNTTMNRRERNIYRLELELIGIHFPGLRPRSIKLIDDDTLLGAADEPNLLVRDKRWRRKELEDLLKHELIHYELKDGGKHYAGHGQAFLKRAKALGVVGLYELNQCHSLEEIEATPTVRVFHKIPVDEYRKDIDSSLSKLVKRVAKLSNDDDKIAIYGLVQSLRVSVTCYVSAIKGGKDHVVEERWSRRRGPKGKSKVELHGEYYALKDQLAPLQKILRENPAMVQDRKFWQNYRAIDGKMDKIRERFERDYGGELY